ncbi:MAG: hypothetical protein WAK14_00245 [Methanobacterium sp.]
MLEYTGLGENPIKLCFIDEESPKELEAVIEGKLLKYNERAYIDTVTEGDKNILVILELNPTGDELNDDKYIVKQKSAFEKYYNNILEEIGASKRF